MKVFEFIGEKGRALTPENPTISGGNPWLKWCDCEPAEGEFDWTRMDEAIAVWSALGKKSIIRVDTSPYWMSPEGTPQWVFDAGAGHIKHPTTGEVFPVYWDPVYLEKWANFVRAFGSRYDSNRNIEFVQTGGAGWFGEMHLGRTWSAGGLRSLEPQWRAAGYTPKTYAKACRFIIDRFMEAFPTKPFCTMVGYPLKDKHLAAEIVDYTVSTYPGRILLQSNGLGGMVNGKPDISNGPNAAVVHNIYDTYRDRVKIVLETIYSLTTGTCPWGAVGSLPECVEIAIAEGASYLMVWKEDIACPDEEVQTALARAAAHAVD